VHIDGKARSDLLDLPPGCGMIPANQWRKELCASFYEAEPGCLRLNAHTRKPLETDGFVSKLEEFLGR
jgi:hypothetical protein